MHGFSASDGGSIFLPEIGNMEEYARELTLLQELDDRHDELLRQLDELDKRVEATLVLWTAGREGQREAA
jgi:hypothetical protein